MKFIYLNNTFPVQEEANRNVGECTANVYRDSRCVRLSVFDRAMRPRGVLQLSPEEATRLGRELLAIGRT